MNKISELTDTEMKLLQLLSSMIDNRLSEKENCDCVTFGDFEDDCQKDFSLKSACRELTKELINHKGELTGSERKHLLELIEAASHVMLYY